MADNNRTKVAKAITAMTYQELVDFCDDTRRWVEDNSAKEEWSKWPSAFNAWAQNEIEDPK